MRMVIGFFGTGIATTARLKNESSSSGLRENGAPHLKEFEPHPRSPSR